MRSAQIQGVSRRRGFVATTRRDSARREAPDPRNRKPHADGLNRLWVEDRIPEGRRPATVDLRRECPDELAVLAPNTHGAATQDADEAHDPACVVEVKEILTGPHFRVRVEGVGGVGMPQLVR